MLAILTFVYERCFDRFVALKLDSTLNSVFMHVVTFGREFNLIDTRSLQPEDLYKELASRHLRQFQLAQ
jgi:hypothetical protein